MPFFNVAGELEFEGNLLFKSGKCIPPESMQGIILNLAHRTHPGISSMKRLVRSFFWWPGMDRFVDRVIRDCPHCVSSEKMLKVHVPPLKVVKWPKLPWQKLAFDISGPFNELQTSSRFALVMIDYHSKWPEVKFVPKATTDAVTTFFKEIFAREGCPATLITDNGVQWTSNEINNFFKECGIKHICTSLYEPHENGQVERFNRVLKTFVAGAVKSGSVWMNELRRKLWIYRITPHSTTEVSPFKLLKGRDPASVVCPWWFMNKCSSRFSEKECVHVTAKRIETKQDKCSKWYNRKWNTKVHDFKKGDWVRILKPGILNKVGNKFGKPIQIKKVFNNCVITQDGKV